jgi:hypothetical protein
LLSCQSSYGVSCFPPSGLLWLSCQAVCTVVSFLLHSGFCAGVCAACFNLDSHGVGYFGMLNSTKAGWCKRIWMQLYSPELVHARTLQFALAGALQGLHLCMVLVWLLRASTHCIHPVQSIFAAERNCASPGLPSRQHAL